MLEDNHEDIIAKAMRGQNIGKSTLAQMAAVERDEMMTRYGISLGTGAALCRNSIKW